MKKINFTIICVLVLICTTTGFSQNFSLHGGAGMPIGDFSDDDGFLDGGDGGGAAIGFNLGAKYTHPLNENGLGLFVGLDVCYNGLTKGVKDDLDDWADGADLTYSKYLNFPLSAGISFKSQSSGNIAFIGNAGLAINFLKITDLKAEIDDFDQTATIGFDMANSIGFKFGGGILMNDKTSIEVTYFALGEHDLDGKVSPSELESFVGEIEKDQKVDIVTITLGVYF
jgi:hypothetical protein